MALHPIRLRLVEKNSTLAGAAMVATVGYIMSCVAIITVAGD